MGSSGKGSNRTSWPVIVIWVITAVICIQGYLFFSRQQATVPVKSSPAVKPVPKPLARPVARPVAGRIAIVLDDWGYNRTHCKNLQAFDAPVTAAILPNLPFSKDILQCAKASGQETMLHLPLEPYVYREKYPRGYILTTEMSQHEVAKLLRSILDEYPGIAGVNNHMGSKGTEDRPLMTGVLKELKRRGLFFVDSVTSGRSVCAQVAGELGVRFAKRLVFLDNHNDRADIEKQFYLGARIAREKGFALIIGHDRALTLQIVAEQIRKLKQQGFEFLTVRDFIKAQGQ